jgi:hypothetical protein
MTRSELIALVLVNSGISFSLSDAHLLIRSTFEKEFADRNFEAWNREIHDSIARKLLDTIGISSNLNLRMFILDMEKF